MCFKNHLIFCDDPLFPGGKDFGDVSCQNVIMIMSLSKSHVVVQCWKNEKKKRKMEKAFVWFCYGWKRALDFCSKIVNRTLINLFRKLEI